LHFLGSQETQILSVVEVGRGEFINIRACCKHSNHCTLKGRLKFRNLGAKKKILLH